MSSSAATSNAQLAIQKALAALRLPVTKPGFAQPRNLYDLLVRQPLNGVGAIVRPTKYADRNYPPASFYKIVSSKIDPSNPTKGEVYAYKYYDGHLVDHTSRAIPKLIPNGYRDKWELVHHAQPATSPYSFIQQAKGQVIQRNLKHRKKGAAAAAAASPSPVAAAAEVTTTTTDGEVKA
ncbi:hypothetical protein BCR44DRAFT_56940 [Catenaria anguillulae PL171]|uniref:Uncharacterized protein n=1 Tax=Catenaria anguillulae PL171 TaxID=765915 RepID=A0A1Y2H9L6_9FUNG|nr:hypothetical protein BCR44DRAFT_56940 [Catenaria anguillulae PL171]